MTDIRVQRTDESDDTLTFDVDVADAGSSSRHVVTLSRADFGDVSDRFSDADEFIRYCFDFLLEREPKESILSRFDVRDIGRYFPEFTRDVLHPGG